MSRLQKFILLVFLASPHLFILVEFLFGIICKDLFIMLSIIYLIMVPSFVIFVLLHYRKTCNQATEK